MGLIWCHKGNITALCALTQAECQWVPRRVCVWIPITVTTCMAQPCACSQAMPRVCESSCISLSLQYLLALLQSCWQDLLNSLKVSPFKHYVNTCVPQTDTTEWLPEVGSTWRNPAVQWKQSTQNLEHGRGLSKPQELDTSLVPLDIRFVKSQTSTCSVKFGIADSLVAAKFFCCSVMFPELELREGGESWNKTKP